MSTIPALTRILHACVLVEGAGARVLIDPCFGFFARRARTSRMFGIRMPAPGLEPQDLGRIDVIAMTHAHEDHFDAEGLARLPSKRALVLVATRSQARAVRRLGFADASVLAPWESAASGACRIQALPARAPNAAREISFLVEMAGLRLLHAGDTARHAGFGEIRERCRPNAGCLPVSGTALAGVRLTMTPAEAAEAAAALGIAVAIPIHAEMRFERLSRLLYRARGSAAEFAERAARVAPGARVLDAPRGTPIDLAPYLVDSRPGD
ncbi:MAG: MBL fold metallo-hydrolase [Acidobacteria bacterium]|nr:MBL fold metallo-hydrolase [Acidobacteriota bacterium]